MDDSGVVAPPDGLVVPGHGLVPLTEEREVQRTMPSPFKNWVDVPIPFKPLGWLVLVQLPKIPELTDGGIALDPKTREKLEFAQYVGKVRAMGWACYTAVSPNGIDLSNTPEEDRARVGDFVVFSKHAGEKFVTSDGTRWAVMTDTELVAPVPEPEVFECDLF